MEPKLKKLNQKLQFLPYFLVNFCKSQKKCHTHNHNNTLYINIIS